MKSKVQVAFCALVLALSALGFTSTATAYDHAKVCSSCTECKGSADCCSGAGQCSGDCCSDCQSCCGGADCCNN